jgi:ribose 1,5-bisphosphokinase
MTADGVFVAVVGPSGAGKDSLIEFARRELRDDDSFVFPRRMITRPADATEQCESATIESFRKAQSQGAFALHWEAHGLLYGLPAAVHVPLAEGRHVVANISRGAVQQARKCFVRTSVVLVTADADVLAARLRARARETQAEQIGRLQRSASGSEPSLRPDIVIENNSDLDSARRAFLRTLRQLTGPRLFALGL